MTQPADVHAPPAVALRVPVPWWAWVWTVNLILLALTYGVVHHVPQSQWLGVLPVSWEHTLGNWWSAMQMLAVGVLGFRCAVQTPPADGTGRWTLAAIGWLGLLMSADELGSMHETLPGYLGVSRLIIGLPFVLLGVPVLAVLWARRARYGYAWLGVVAGCGMLAAMEPLENWKHALGLSEPWRVAFVAIEEGVELLAVTLLIAALLNVSRRLDNSDAARAGATWLAALRGAAVAVAVMALPMIALRYLADQAGMIDAVRHGDLGMTPAVLLFALAAWTCFLRAGQGADRPAAWLALGMVAAAATIEAACHLRYRLAPFTEADPRNTLLLWALPAAALIACALPGLRRTRILLAAGLLLLGAIGVLTWYKTPVAQAYMAAVSAAAALCLTRPASAR